MKASGRWNGLERLFRHLRRGAAAYGVLLISLLLTTLAWYYVRDTVEKQNEVRFEETVRATQAAVDRRTDDYLDAMFGARGLILASESVTPSEWTEYVKGVEPGSRLGGLQALAYAERVGPPEREDFVRRMEDEGLPAIRPDLDPGGERDVYFPVSLAAPANEANQEMFGRDEYPYAVYRTAMDRARNTGSPRATKTTYVLTKTPRDLTPTSPGCRASWFTCRSTRPVSPWKASRSAGGLCRGSSSGLSGGMACSTPSSGAASIRP